jgi:hypothetical protein
VGTDREVEAKGPCPCGLGEIVVYRCTGDHPFASGGHWWEDKITCPLCAKEYALGYDDPGKAPALVLRSEIIARENRLQAWHEQTEALMASPEVKELIGRFVQSLEAEPSTAAKYRLLRKHNLVNSSQATFTRKFAGCVIYAATLSPSDLSNVMSVLGHSDSILISRVQAIDATWSAVKAPLNPIKTGISGLAA